MTTKTTTPLERRQRAFKEMCRAIARAIHARESFANSWTPENYHDVHAAEAAVEAAMAYEELANRHYHDCCPGRRFS